MFKQIIYFMLIVFCGIIVITLAGCKSCPPTIVTTNNLTQTNYDYQCLSGEKSFSEIIVCYKTQDKAEKAQNDLTNKMLETK